MKRIHFLWLLVCVLIACKDKVETTSPVRENITESVYASGILKSLGQYQVFATVNGLLQNVLVDEGDTVRKGAPLFIIQNEISTLSRENAQLAADLADYKSNQNKLDELKLNIDLAKSKMLNDSLLMIRQQSLWAQNLGSKVDVEKAELNYQNSKTIYTSARLRYADEKRRLDILSKQAKKNLEITRESEKDFTITSKINGKIYSLIKEQGEMVNTQTPLAVIGDATEFMLELQVDEYDITSVKTGQKVIVTMDSYKGETFEAMVTKVNPILNERTKTAIVEARFVNHPPAMYPNLTLEANIIIQVKENVLTVPRQYILNDHFVINEAGDTLTIKTGVVDYRKAEILEGISEKDVLIRPGS
ncbi:MAG TPA: efflux RND transporter periplasmic adaptor subunit [Saprospiraceae bacterium]|jgi:HlyD family secretion protein